MAIERIDPRFLDSVWPSVSTHLQRAIDLDPSYTTIDQLKLTIRRGAAHLLVWTTAETLHGAVVVEFIDHPQKRVAHLMAMGGKSIVCREVLEALAEWCRNNGAVAIEGWCDEPHARLYHHVGFAECARVMRLEL